MWGFFYRATKDSSGQPNSQLCLLGSWNRDNLEFFLISSTAKIQYSTSAIRSGVRYFRESSPIWNPILVLLTALHHFTTHFKVRVHRSTIIWYRCFISSSYFQRSFKICYHRKVICKMSLDYEAAKFWSYSISLVKFKELFESCCDSEALRSIEGTLQWVCLCIDSKYYYCLLNLNSVIQGEWFHCSRLNFAPWNQWEFWFSHLSNFNLRQTFLKYALIWFSASSSSSSSSSSST